MDATDHFIDKWKEEKLNPEKLFHLTVWGRDDSAPHGYSKISGHTVTAVNGLEAARRVARWNNWADNVWMDSPENGGRPEIIIRNDTKE